MFKTIATTIAAAALVVAVAVAAPAQATGFTGNKDSRQDNSYDLSLLRGTMA